ncbi:hypothetical protein BpHYR1_020495 [Brachionus plicatilis]|uniref:Uncharacterized protein n=1 Tax=Brachionus plicatilis TaxID=10195 RepID=A0A3M7RXR3_BRAPC|nr:hypothetical protein BpHYR1_020495 [Brachionus plicatilis]
MCLKTGQFNSKTMKKTLKEKRLDLGFTLRVVNTSKSFVRIKINIVSTTHLHKHLNYSSYAKIMVLKIGLKL